MHYNLCLLSCAFELFFAFCPNRCVFVLAIYEQACTIASTHVPQHFGFITLPVCSKIAFWTVCFFESSVLACAWLPRFPLMRLDIYVYHRWYSCMIIVSGRASPNPMQKLAPRHSCLLWDFYSNCVLACLVGFCDGARSYLQYLSWCAWFFYSFAAWFVYFSQFLCEFWHFLQCRDFVCLHAISHSLLKFGGLAEMMGNWFLLFWSFCFSLFTLNNLASFSVCHSVSVGCIISCDTPGLFYVRLKGEVRLLLTDYLSR